MFSCGESSDSGGSPQSTLDSCAFFDDANNCFTRLTQEALSCVGAAFSQSPGTLSVDGLQCSSTDGQVTTSFAQPITGQMDAMIDVTVKRGETLCFHYKGMGSGSTPAEFASASLTLEMTTDQASGDLVLRCEGKTFRGNIFQKCSGTKTLPSVGTSYSSTGTGKKITMNLGLGKDVYDCE